MNLDNRLAGKVVLVTGGGSGLGKGACQRIAAEGAAVAIVDIREALAEETASEIRSAGGRAIAIGCDHDRSDRLRSRSVIARLVKILT